ncbi:ogr/Delta-like zinc finger family protein [Pectobacterium polaris]|uniref:ogr/Delta-like zinc finger family protein n=1 Tax=Pectobacterium polaris TaxID=2042057 RepID=UPI0035207929
MKRTQYQCTNLDCSCTFTVLESVEKVIMKLQKPAVSEPAATVTRSPEQEKI